MTQSISIRTPSVEQPCIELVFDPIADRWRHRWIAMSGSAKQVILASREGTSEQIWPPSPPLQDINLHSLEPGDAVLGVGMAGKSHWSASFSLEKQNGNTRNKSIKMDLACLAHNLSDHSMIGSVYEIDPACELRSFSQQRIEWVVESGPSIVLEAFSCDPCQTLFELDDRCLTLRPVSVPNRPNVSIRWGFDVRLEAPAS